MWDGFMGRLLTALYITAMVAAYGPSPAEDYVEEAPRQQRIHSSAQAFTLHEWAESMASLR
jgi:hypothetical protein